MHVAAVHPSEVGPWLRAQSVFIFRCRVERTSRPRHCRTVRMTQCMVRPCVARGFRRIWRIAVLHQCIRPLIGARCVLRAIMDISARAISLADRPRPGHLGHQCSHAPGRPILHLVSSSRRPRRVNWATSSCAPYLAQFLCSCREPFLRPGLRVGRRAARKGPSRLAVALPRLSLRCCQATP